jgi:beta-glucanase (GH16 family)
MANPSWKLVWSDEFDGSGHPDPEKWSYEVGFIRNQEPQFYTQERLKNARVEDGVLVIEAHREQYANPLYDEDAEHEELRDGLPREEYERISNATKPFAEYSSASLITRGKAEWQYGRFEIRAKLPSGRGIWPAIWMLGTSRGRVPWPDCGELDIMEYVGYEPNTVHANVHCPARVKKAAPLEHFKGMLTVSEPYADFHRYGMVWDAERISFSFDDEVYLTYENPHTGDDAWPFDQPFYLLLNVGVGGGWGGRHGIDDDIFPQRMEIDYVRVYEAAEAILPASNEADNMPQD